MKVYFYLLLLMVLSLGCKRKNIEPNLTFEISELKHSFIVSYKSVSKYHSLNATLMNDKISDFYYTPLIHNFNNARESWKTCRKYFHYLQPFSMMNNSSVENPIHYNVLNVETGKINPSYIDSTSASPTGGIVVDPVNYPSISYLTVPGWHQTSTTNKTLGFQVVEFLLWGENGNRVHQDFINANATTKRRRDFLQASGSRLSVEIGNDFYSSSFEDDIQGLNKEEFLSYILGGLIEFIEVNLTQSSLETPFQSQNKDDVLSNFSKNTKNEIRDKLNAIKLILDGREFFTTHNDFFLIDFIRLTDESLANEIESLHNNSMNDLVSIQGDFNTAITSLNERPKIASLISNLNKLSEGLRQFANDQGVIL